MVLEPRYAFFEGPKVPSRWWNLLRLTCARFADLSRSLRISLPSTLAIEMQIPALASPGSVTFMNAADAAYAMAEGNKVFPVPRMPLRLIPQVATDATITKGEPWGIQAVGADRSEFTGAGVCVAVLDTGIDRTHPAFTGLINDENYKDFTETGLDDTVGHGTHCAGIIFGRDLHGMRIGVAREVTQVLIGKIADRDTVTSTEKLEEALLWAVRQGADIISMSVGLDFLGHAKQLQKDNIPQDAALAAALSDYWDYARFFDNLMHNVISPGAADRSALVVAAAGNDSHADSTPAYRIGVTLPAVVDGVVAVGAVERTTSGLAVAPFSNTGAQACAPGVDILSALPAGRTGGLTGTSQAAPHVAGVAALWWEKIRVETSERPSPAAVRTAMLGKAERSKISPPASMHEIGQGLVMAP